jgi:magnesium transporter
VEEEKKVLDLVLELVEERKFVQLRELTVEMNPADIAALFTEIEEKEIPLVYRLLPKDLASEVFAYMETETQELLIHSFSDFELKEVFADLFLDDTVDIIEEMPANVVSRILRLADPNSRRQINELLKYPEDSAGSIMTVEYVALNKNRTVLEAFTKIRTEGIDKETVYTCYVTENRKLLGTVTVKDLLLAGDNEKMSEIMDTNCIYIDAYEDKEVVAKTFSKYDILALPVVDKDGRIVGIVTVDDAMDVMEEEATEDIEKMAAIISDDRPYLKTGAVSIWLKRIPWLLLLMVSATVTGGIIGSFESALTAFPALVAFIPMLMGTGGNAGGQTSVTVIRGLAIGEINMGDILKVVWKEIRVSVLCGAALSIVGFLKILLIDNLLLSSGVSLLESAVVCVTLAVTVLIANVIGCTLPILVKRLGLDPAVMASPFITTIVDAVSLAVYFAVASKILCI